MTSEFGEKVVVIEELFVTHYNGIRVMELLPKRKPRQWSALAE